MSKYAKLVDVEIFYQLRGQGDPLVLLMGFGADGNTWEKHLQVYENHFQCLVIDNRGVGKSGQPIGPYTTAMMADDTAAVMNDAGISIAKIAGISMGGAIAQELALRHPDKVQCLVLISTWPSFNKYATTVYENLKKLRPVCSPQDFMELLQLWIFAPPFYQKNLAELQEAQQAAATNQNPQSREGFEGQLDSCISHNTVDRLNQIKVPSFITVGEMDIFTPPEFSKILNENIAGSEFVTFPEGGHVHHWEDLERFNRITTEFLLNN